MPSSILWRAWLILLLALLLTVGYEALRSVVPWLQRHTESSHFWTPYDTTATGTGSDTAAIAALLGTDSAAWEPQKGIASDSLPFISADSVQIVVPELDNYEGKQYLGRFQQAIAELKMRKRKRVRVAYFGDSTTQGDLCVGVLRDTLQRMLGGRGVGFVPLITRGTGIRTTLHHHYTKETWTTKQYFRGETDVQFDFGISGDYSTGKDQTLTVRFEAADPRKWTTSDTFTQVYLYYGRYVPSGQAHGSPTLHITSDKAGGGGDKTITLSDTALVNRVLIAEDCRQVQLTFTFSDPLPIYGVSFEGGEGVYIDNLAKRNDSGSHLTKIKPAIMEAFNAFFDYDLIVFHYGPNVLQRSVSNYSYYEDIIVRNIAYLRQQFPKADILVVGNSDQGARIGGKMQTEPNVYALIKAQQRAAVRSRSAFFDLFEAMGGAGTMVRWANDNPPKVAQDYVHFNHEGSAVVGGLLSKWLGGGVSGWQGATGGSGAIAPER